MLGNRKSQHSFSKIPAVNMARSVFDRSFGTKLTCNFDYLVPIFVDEVLPGDTCNITMSTFARLTTQLVPIMDNLYLDYFFFYVSNRLVWVNWEKFCGAQDNPGDSTNFTIPVLATFTAPQPAVGSVFDYMGLPCAVAGNLANVNALPFRCLNLIYNTWFRDQNLINSLSVPTDNGPDPLADYSLQLRAKAHDYFTSCLPWPQKGTAINLPLAASAPVISDGTNPKFVDAGGLNNLGLAFNAPVDSRMLLNANPTTAGLGLFDTTHTGLKTDLSGSAVTINVFRQAIMVQSLLELDARGGTRLTEIIQNHFQVTVPDFRVQRPEYLGGGTSKIIGHPVAQTAPVSGSEYKGDLAAFATSTGRAGFSKSIVEHGYVIGLVQARADITYQEGLNRMYSRQTRYDFFWPKFQEMGEQAVLNQEIFTAGAGGNDSGVFGYQERYAEYRYKPSEIHGELRSTYSAPLDPWHMAQHFGSLPSLNQTFISSNTPIQRSIAVTTHHQLIIDAWFQYKHVRPMMTYSVPATLGRF